jgi:hypothetical protein
VLLGACSFFSTGDLDRLINITQIIVKYLFLSGAKMKKFKSVFYISFLVSLLTPGVFAQRTASLSDILYAMDSSIYVREEYPMYPLHIQKGFGDELYMTIMPNPNSQEMYHRSPYGKNITFKCNAKNRKCVSDTVIYETANTDIRFDYGSTTTGCEQGFTYSGPMRLRLELQLLVEDRFKFSDTRGSFVELLSRKPEYYQPQHCMPISKSKMRFHDGVLTGKYVKQ